MSQTGSVHLVGAGPGDPELITLRGLRCLQSADVVIYDRLIAPELLEEAPPWAERIFAGKSAGNHVIRQEEIQRLMIDRARRGLEVVRLKGGDPYLFGRGGEEGQALTEASIPWDVVPGITSAIGVPASAGIPVTHRGTAASFAVVTAHRCGTAASEPDWDAFAGVDTLVVLMGVGTLQRTVGRLLEAGRPPETPAAVIQDGTTPLERVVTGTLQDIASRVQMAGVSAPATIVIGDVVRLRDELISGTATTPRPKHTNQTPLVKPRKKLTP